MLKTKEYLKSQFETGDIPTGEDYENLIDSFWHKSELGQVAEGDARPVTGGDVQAAIAAAMTAEVLRPIVASLLSEMLPALLSEFVTGTTLSSALNGVATQTWVQNQIADKVDTATMNTALTQKADLSGVYTKAEADNLLAAKAATEDVPDISGLVSQTALTEALALKADAASVYAKQQIDAAMAARPTQTESASETSTAINNAVAALPNNATISTLRTKINEVITRVNTLGHVACGSETMNSCPDVEALQEPTP